MIFDDLFQFGSASIEVGAIVYDNPMCKFRPSQSTKLVEKMAFWGGSLLIRTCMALVTTLFEGLPAATFCKSDV